MLALAAWDVCIAFHSDTRCMPSFVLLLPSMWATSFVPVQTLSHLSMPDFTITPPLPQPYAQVPKFTPPLVVQRLDSIEPPIELCARSMLSRGKRMPRIRYFSPECLERLAQHDVRRDCQTLTPITRCSRSLLRQTRRRPDLRLRPRRLRPRHSRPPRFLPPRRSLLHCPHSTSRSPQEPRNPGSPS